MIYQPAALQQHASAYHLKDEADIYSFWMRQKGNSFQTKRGRIKILHPGQRNFYSGPDFTKAAIEYPDGRRQYGDIEIHEEWKHWKQHKHQNNPLYSSLILHVVLHGQDLDINISDIYQVPTIVLPNPAYLKTAFACDKISIQLSTSVLDIIIQHSAWQRWEYLQRYFRNDDHRKWINRVLTMADPKCNSGNIRKSQKFVNQYLQTDDIPLVTFLNDLTQFTERLSWVMGRKRPNSHPRRRIPILAFLCRLLFIDPEIVQSINLKQLQEYNHYLQIAGYKTAGRNFLQEIMGNIILPMQQVQVQQDIFEDWYHQPVQTYGITKSRLAIWKFNKKVTFGLQQGILQLEKDYCQHHICENCPLINYYTNHIV